MKTEPLTIPPRPRREEPHALDPMLEALSGLSTAIREQSREFCAALGKVTESVNVLGGRLDGQSRAAQELAAEIRSFVDDKERLRGRVVMLEMIEKERREANGTDAE